MINVGIVGATGYVASQLIAILLNHDKINISRLYSNKNATQDIFDTFPSFYKISDMKYSSDENYPDECDLIFSCLPAGESEKYAIKAIENGVKFIDLGSDFRLKDEKSNIKWYGKNFEDKELHKKAVYGLSEIFEKEIKNADIIANPGCYPTSVVLGLAPLLSQKTGFVEPIIIDSKSGLTGSGKKLSENSHFINANENFKPYAVGGHRHLPEIEQALSKISGKSIKTVFTPHLLPVNRGILSSIYINLTNNINLDEIHKIYRNFYKDKFFVRILEKGEIANLRQVQNSNFVNISLHKDSHTNTLIVISAIDNMIKGAAGQAVQNMNLIFNFKENEGLNLIPNTF